MPKMDKLPPEIGRVSSMLLLKIGNNERIPVQAQRVLYLTLQYLPLSFFSSSLVPFAFQWGGEKKKGLQNVLVGRTPAPSIQPGQRKPGAHVVKKRNRVDDKDKDGRKVKRYIRGNVCQVQSA